MSEDKGIHGAAIDVLEPGDRVGTGEQGKGKGMTKQPWDVEIDVHLTKGCPDPTFELQTHLPTQNGKFLFENNHRPGFNVTFTLFDDTGEGYVFPAQAQVKDACWSQAGTSCPTSPVWDVFDPRHVDHNGTTLTVYNENPSPPIGDFQFTLRVTKDGGASYCALDPGGSDMNGPRS